MNLNLFQTPWMSVKLKIMQIPSPETKYYQKDYLNPALTKEDNTLAN